MKLDNIGYKLSYSFPKLSITKSWIISIHYTYTKMTNTPYKIQWANQTTNCIWKAHYKTIVKKL